MYGQVIILGITPEYFFDKMSFDEVNALLKEKADENKQDWEKIRHLCFYNVVSFNGTKLFKKPADLFKFPWEKNNKEPKILTEAEKRKNKQIAQKLIKKING